MTQELTKRAFVLKEYRKPVNKMEHHLVSVARQWAAGQGSQELNTLDELYNALLREKQFYLADHARARTTSAVVIKQASGIIIRPGDMNAGPTIRIECEL